MSNRELNRDLLRGKEFLEFQNTPETLDGEKRTVDVIWFTGIEVPRFDFWTGETYIRRFDSAGADLSFLNGGAPVLANHSAWGDGRRGGYERRRWRQRRRRHHGRNSGSIRVVRQRR